MRGNEWDAQMCVVILKNKSNAGWSKFQLTTPFHRPGKLILNYNFETTSQQLFLMKEVKGNFAKIYLPVERITRRIKENNSENERHSSEYITMNATLLGTALAYKSDTLCSLTTVIYSLITMGTGCKKKLYDNNIDNNFVSYFWTILLLRWANKEKNKETRTFSTKWKP